MQEEILKHSKKIYKSAKDQNHTIKEKIGEIFIEIFIIVFAVSLSIWLHGWSEHRHQQKEVREFLGDLKEDLKTDVRNVSKSKEELLRNIKDYKFILGLTPSQIDSLKKNRGSIGLNWNISTTKINNGNYEGFKSSGKIGYIENKKLKRMILKYYQEQTPGLLETEKYGGNTSEKILNFVSEHSDQTLDKIIMMPRFKQQLKLHTDLTHTIIGGYAQTEKDASAIIKEIEELEN
jgi:Family of unknown function (DUF6090)